jgi:2-polyprenyl-3-methyl-5-hydroxy-6-metoxy-1,4-benzoquinol methylase
MDRNVDHDWYKKVFTIESLDMPWAEQIVEETQVVIDMVGLSGGETILDLACGFGHHAMELARQGYRVVGVDIARDFIDYAVQEAARRELAVDFICSDLRELDIGQSFDVVLSLFDGAIGYFESERENLKTFSVIASYLNSGGKHLMQIPNPEYARKHFPCRTWCAGKKMLEIMEYDWDEADRQIYASTQAVVYGEVFAGLSPIKTRQRAYDLEELEALLSSVDMTIDKVTSLMDKSVPVSDRCEYISVVSHKN